MSQTNLQVGETQDLYGAAEIDRFQHFHRKFDFWTKDALDRTVSRSAKSLGDTTAPINNQAANVVTKFDTPIIDFPAIFNKKTVGEISVNTMQEWECVVEEISDDIVYSKARPLIGQASGVEYMKIPCREFSAEDKQILAPGTVFRLIIGFAKKPNGSNTRQALTYIRRYLPRDRRGLDEMIQFLSEERHARLPGAR